ncbi:hypothetical protein J3Q64DRAFT_1694127 [Phycomyces blakesleeanus]|uniref:Uncharacterized protein n=2 Tax=Phycomyces blakesleeanus TaxID=4837 RepID=A0A162V2S2_PHYB8|nr:hypothetical protein PHYBLDRAFT_58609 [Phycomyces blakesleeanus NRRL 1555(-)]OAD79563.1 hypothetical protein PHYBLDRAFT_58609 [Phycomyces blakesleeanus NRRL 1555(-)]|eukprot:XP_018297603.1 hypothetical protein PHYBLDRAFT_58609 [Phycomyces blakesleeanus NRRL 1555(-)]
MFFYGGLTARLDFPIINSLVNYSKFTNLNYLEDLAFYSLSIVCGIDICAATNCRHILNKLRYDETIPVRFTFFLQAGNIVRPREDVSEDFYAKKNLPSSRRITGLKNSKKKTESINLGTWLLLSIFGFPFVLQSKKLKYHPKPILKTTKNLAKLSYKLSFFVIVYYLQNHN